ncbi:hypothetical protein SSP35_06_00900 [Streptomyces sp. NBRC 110611]|uniref:hypothetical protein n=1 Tax=Streptomyces sp. NBRC 110611 TaxID=1621259 RepID=UPI00082ACD8E|nr:hypothetical protein [Streptomyces sp. NBRC 110611]GAU68006.1 hypothetical protein SSP35_06_00900 [Streptomyces sp. NBRC 110611]
MAPRTSRTRRRPLTPALAALAAATVAVPLLAACGAVQKAVGCARTATSVVNAVDKLQQAAGDSLTDPQKSQEALDDIEQNLKKVSDEAGDPELSQAVDKTNNGIKDARKAIEDGKAPNIKPIADGASEIAKVCTPG